MPFSNFLLHCFRFFFFLSFLIALSLFFQISKTKKQTNAICMLPPKYQNTKQSVYFADRKIALSYEQKNAFRWLLNTAPHSPRRQKLNLRMKSLSLDSPESSELHGNMKRRYPLTGATHFNMQGGSAGLLDHNTPTSNNSRLHCKRKNHHIFIAPTVLDLRMSKFIFLFIFTLLDSYSAAESIDS